MFVPIEVHNDTHIPQNMSFYLLSATKECFLFIWIHHFLMDCFMLSNILTETHKSGFKNKSKIIYVKVIIFVLNLTNSVRRFKKKLS